jgi:hypothetical protein
VKVRWLEVRHGIGDGLQVVQQHDATQAEGLAQGRFLDVPGQIGEVRAPADDRTGYIEAGMIGRSLLDVTGSELIADQAEARTVPATKALGRAQSSAGIRISGRSI